MASEVHSVICLVEETERGKPRSAYIKLSLEKKAEIGKYANKNGVAYSVRQGSETYVQTKLLFVRIYSFYVYEFTLCEI